MMGFTIVYVKNNYKNPADVRVFIIYMRPEKCYIF